MYGNYSNGYFNAHPWFTPQPQPQPHTTGVNAPTSQNNGSRPFPPQQPVTSSSTSSSSDIVQALNDKSTEELQRLLLDDDAYNTFLQNSSGNALAQGWVVSTCLFGAFFGCATSGSIADTFGRRRAFQLSTVPMLLGACISASASNLNSMILGRLLVGVGLGISGPVTALYVTEISPTAVRGTFGSLAQIANCIGILGALVMGLPVATIPGWWRKCFWIATMPAALLAIGMEFCSESPRWLFKSSRLADAEHEIERLWGAAYVKCALSELIRGEKHEEDEPATFADLLSDRYRKASRDQCCILLFIYGIQKCRNNFRFGGQRFCWCSQPPRIHHSCMPYG